jgi:hypothetical protein
VRVQRRHFSPCYNKSRPKLMLLFFMERYLVYVGKIVALGGESCCSCRQPGGDSCVVIYNWTLCTCQGLVLTHKGKRSRKISV